MDKRLLEQVQKYIEDEFFDLTPIREMEAQGIKFSLGLRWKSSRKHKLQNWVDRIKQRINTALTNSNEDSFAERLFRLIKAKQLTEVEVYKKAH